jgi:sugar fermentation stimulation protein A
MPRTSGEKATRAHCISWPPLTQGRLIRRYKRFLADIELPDGHRLTAHCPNTGRMKGCCEPGRPVFLSEHDNPARKFRYTWELIEMPTSLVGVNTAVPNRLVFESLKKGEIPDLAGYAQVRSEVKISDHSRIDIVLSNGPSERCLVEIKNCTFVENGVGRFPDAVTERGLKHLRELRDRVARKDRCAMFYLVQRMDADAFSPAEDIDPAYADELVRAVKAGVEVIAYDVAVDLEGIALRRKLPVILPA